MFRIYFEKLKLALQKRIKSAQTQKSYATWKAKGYDNSPLVTVIFQTHNKSVQICHLLGKLRKSPLKPEIIVIDDGSSLEQDRKSTRLNSSHANISYAVFCLK